MKKQLTLSDAKKYALSSFIVIDKPEIDDDYFNSKYANAKVKYEFSIRALEENIFVDNYVIFTIPYIKKLIKVWDEIISFGEDYPFKDRVPEGYKFCENKFDFVFKTLARAYRFKMIFNYCRKKLKYKKYV